MICSSESASRTTPATPSAGDVLFYPGGYSETELLIAYGACSFASRMGPLAGNHFMTLVDGRERLRALGNRVLWEGAVDVQFDLDDTSECSEWNTPQDDPDYPPAGHVAADALAGTRRHVDMAAPAPAPRPVTIASTPQQVTFDLQSHRADDHRHAERLLHARGLGRPPGRRLHARPRADRAAAAAAAGLARGRRAGAVGELGQSPGSGQHAAQPAPPVQAARAGHRTRRPVARPRRARPPEGQLGCGGGRRTGDRGHRHLRRQAPHQRLLGHAARLDPPQPRRSTPSCLRG